MAESPEIARLRKQVETLIYKVQELTGERGNNPAVRISSSTSDANLLIGTIRWNPTDALWQRWNGVAWEDLTQNYHFTGITASGDVTLEQALTVEGQSQFNDDVTVDAALAVTGDASVGGDLDVTGAVTLGKTDVTSPTAADGNVFSGTYTPTLTNVTNLADSTAYACQYLRVGDVVTVSGAVAMDATAAGAVELRVSLPIASDFTSSVQAGGAYAMQASASDKGVILADVTNNALIFRHVAATLTNQVFNFTATYRVL